MLVVALSINALLMWAQDMTPVSEKQSQEMIMKINSAASGMKTMKSSFTQTKKLKMMNKSLVSSGEMYYEQSSKLRWEYLSPYKYLFIINGSKVTMKNSKKTDVVDVNQNKVFQEIAKIMMNTMTGKCLTDKSSFSTTMYLSDNLWVARLLPQRKEMKQVFSEIWITFDPAKLLPTEVVMKDKNGDTTTIKLSDTVKNATIPSVIFSAG